MELVAGDTHIEVTGPAIDEGRLQFASLALQTGIFGQQNMEAFNLGD